MISGLNWCTTTVVNTIENKNGFAQLVNGKSTGTFPTNIAADTTKKSLLRVVTEGTGAAANKCLQVAHVMNFYKNWDNRYGKVTKITKAPSIAGELAEVEIDFAELDLDMESPVKMYKLFVYISIDGANPFYYSNDFNVKGLPFGCEFTVIKGETATEVAKKVYGLITKNHIFQLDTDQLDVTLDGSKVTLTAKETFQRFALVKIAEFGPWDDYSIPVANLVADKLVITESATGAAEVSVPVDKFGVITCNAVGKNEFGTAAQIGQDLRLPTIENLKWGSSTNWQQPLPGRTYTQYIFTVQAPSNNGGVMAVGERMLSETTHIFWVVEDEVTNADFDKSIEDLGLELTAIKKADGSDFAEIEKATNEGKSVENNA